VQRVRDGETVTLFHMTGKIGIGLPLFGRRRPLLWAIFTAVMRCSTAVIAEQQNGSHDVDIKRRNRTDSPT